MLLDLSGDRRPSGAVQRDATQLWIDAQQDRGSAATRVRVRVVDVAGSDAKVLIELRRAVEEEHADAVIVGTPVTPQLGAFAAAVEVARVPVLMTLPASEALASRWLFALAPSREQLARLALDDATARGIAAPDMQLLVSESTAAQAESAALAAEAARRKLTPMAVANVERPDAGFTPARLVAATSAFHVLGAPRDAAALSRQAGGPRYYLSYLTAPSELGAFREVPATVWPGSSRVVAVDTTGRPAASAQFVRAFTDRHGPPSTHAASVYDALSLLQRAAEGAGTDDHERLRARIEGTTFAGIAATYAFSNGRHAGFSLDDLAYVAWSGSAVVPAPVPPLVR